MKTGSFKKSTDIDSTEGQFNNAEGQESPETIAEDDVRVKQIIRRMRIHIWAGTLIGFAIALAIGAAFIAVVRCGVSIRPLTAVLHQA